MGLYCLIWAEPPVQFPFANLYSKAMDACIFAFVKDANSIAHGQNIYPPPWVL